MNPAIKKTRGLMGMLPEGAQYALGTFGRILANSAIGSFFGLKGKPTVIQGDGKLPGTVIEDRNPETGSHKFLRIESDVKDPFFSVFFGFDKGGNIHMSLNRGGRSIEIDGQNKIQVPNTNSIVAVRNYLTNLPRHETADINTLRICAMQAPAPTHIESI